jgi:predicted phage-related endonuclease
MKAKLQSKMKEADKAVAGDFSMTWKSQTRNTLDTKALKEAHPDIAAAFNRESSSRVFLIKKIKKAV